MTSEMPDDPKRPGRDDDDAVDDDAEEEDDDTKAEREQRERDDRTFKDELENADEFEPTLDVPLPTTNKSSRKRRAGL